MRLILLGIMLGSALFVPTALNAQDNGHDQNARSQGTKTYYDAAHKDRHEWNDNENTAWNKYRDDHHVAQADFAKTSKRQQQDYWNWRHEHPDQH